MARMVRGSSIMKVMHWRWMASYSSSSRRSRFTASSAARRIQPREDVQRIVQIAPARRCRGAARPGSRRRCRAPGRAGATMLAILCASSPTRSRSVMVLMIASTRRRSEAAGARVASMRLHSSSISTSMRLTRASPRTTSPASARSAARQRLQCLAAAATPPGRPSAARRCAAAPGPR